MLDTGDVNKDGINSSRDASALCKSNENNLPYLYN